MLDQYIKQFLHHKYTFLVTAAFLVIPLYSWKSFFKHWENLKREYEEKIIFLKRHNCVVTYQTNKGLAGWPPHTKRYNTTGKKVFEELCQPILYYIKTAKKSLDLCVMIINVNVIYTELIRARRNGVKIRIVMNFYHTDSSREEIRSLMAEGVKFQFFIAPGADLETIMHNKYIIKDFDENEGYICTGSMNFTTSSFVNNYESFIFTSNHNVVKAFKSNFEECWHNLELDNEGIVNKTILMDAQFV